MSSDTIYEILMSKNGNQHYIKKYVNFIVKCLDLNKIRTTDLKKEKHHILPKSKDFFPEYSCFIKYPWNKAELTPRQHYIAHLILCKAFPNSVMVYAAYRMYSYNSSRQITSRLYESMRSDFIKMQSENAKNQNLNMSHDQKRNKSIKISAYNKDKISAVDKNGKPVRVTKEEFESGEYVGNTKGKALVKDKNGKHFLVDSNDPRIKTGELCGVNKGRKFSEEVRKRMGDSNRGIIHKTVKCPNCGKEGRETGMKRWHFSNCREITSQ